MGRPKLPTTERRIQLHPSVKPDTMEIIDRVIKLYSTASEPCSPGRAIDIIVRTAANNPDFSKTLANVDKLIEGV